MPARNLTPAFNATDCEEDSSRRWSLTDLSGQCFYCGSKAVEVIDASALLNIAACRDCLVDALLTRFVAVKNQRLARVAQDMAEAGCEIQAARRRAREERRERDFEAMRRKGTFGPRRAKGWPRRRRESHAAVTCLLAGATTNSMRDGIGGGARGSGLEAIRRL
jgi:hypothetical protein